MTTSSATTRRLRSPEGEAILTSFVEPIRRNLAAVDAGIGLEQAPELDQLIVRLAGARELYREAPDEVFDDIFVLECYVRIFGEYGLLWRQIANSQFSESWRTLQNIFDKIRLVRRFSTIDVGVVEDQLCALETLYPYSIFFSVGAVVGQFECSICGEDIDSFKCMHRRGELYRGQMAVARPRNFVQLDHVAMVEKPVDKRCTISYGNDAPEFQVVRYLADLLSTRSLNVLGFAGAVWGTRVVRNERHREMARNERCYCESGRKYKKCCIGKAFVEQDHVEIMPGLSILARGAA